MPGAELVIDTARVKGRRPLRFGSPAEALADAERLAASAKAGKLKALGNWTPGQALGHLAGWINFGYEGPPSRPPWIVRVILRVFMKKKFLRDGFPSGFRMSGVPGGTYAIEELSVDEGLARYRKAWARLQAGTPQSPNAAFGPLTPDEWIRLNLRHAELHQSFFVPG